MYKLIFIENPHDARSGQIKKDLEELGLAQEVHFVNYEHVTGIPLQAAPCIFLLGSMELQTDFNAADVVDHLKHMMNKTEIEQTMKDLSEMLREGGLL